MPPSTKHTTPIIAVTHQQTPSFSFSFIGSVGSAAEGSVGSAGCVPSVAFVSGAVGSVGSAVGSTVGSVAGSVGTGSVGSVFCTPSACVITYPQTVQVWGVFSVAAAPGVCRLLSDLFAQTEHSCQW